MPGNAYAGIRRKKQTPWTVKFGDALVSRLIAAGGIGTIAAVMLVVLVLLATAWPLLLPTSVGPWRTLKIPAANWRHFALDDDSLLVWGISDRGTISVYSLAESELLVEFPHPDLETSVSISASSLSIDQHHVAVGYNDGSFQTVGLHMQSNIVPSESLPSQDMAKGNGGISVAQRTVYRRFDAQSFLSVTISPPQWSKKESAGSAAVSAIDFLPPDNTNQFAQASESKLALVAGEELIVATVSVRKNLLTGTNTEEISTQRVAFSPRSADARPLGLAVLNRGTQAIVVWPTGTLDRFNLEQAQPRLVESISGIPAGGRFTCMSPLLGRQTLLCGDVAGTLSGWMVVHQEPLASSNTSSPVDGYRLVAAHSIAVGSQPLQSIASSQRSHTALSLAENGQLALTYVTTDDLLRSVKLSPASELKQASLAPKGDSLAVISPSELTLATLSLSYPEASWRGLFGRTWYEGYDGPKYIWQSTSGTEMSETKLSLIPLVFGTVKATVYAMLISVPLAILAAIYTSEFFSARARNRVKPLVEMMASLPSVVLGFIAALILAPLLQKYLCAVLLSLIVVPFTFLMAGHLWNLLPVERLIRYQPLRIGLLLLTVPLGVMAAATLSVPIEHWLFGGDTSLWLNSRSGSALGGWMLVLVPVFAMLAVAVCLGPLADITRRMAGKMTPRGFGLIMLLRLLILVSIVLLSAWAIGSLLTSVRLDSRDIVFGEYKERNAMLVGAILGFCVIPIIYTIADDALQAVPQQLRSASLGCGATPWQTTVRVVVPSAMSGLFSAVMIGLGRAVGETMVVLMAAGNTPVMEWNPFNGFRTLSATLATELPEAAKGSTHYRTLFLAALLLFFLTLIVNTIAEFVRIRFRRRASQL